MREVCREHLEWVPWRVLGIREDHGAVVARVVLDGEVREVLPVRVHKARVPHLLGRPLRVRRTRGDDVVLDWDVCVRLPRLGEERVLAEEVVWAVGRVAVPVRAVEVRLVCRLEGDQPIAKDGLAELGDLETPVRGVVERDTCVETIASSSFATQCNRITHQGTS